MPSNREKEIYQRAYAMGVTLELRRQGANQTWFGVFTLDGRGQYFSAAIPVGHELSANSQYKILDQILDLCEAEINKHSSKANDLLSEVCKF